MGTTKLTVQIVDLMVKDGAIIASRCSFETEKCSIKECQDLAAKLAPHYEKEELRFKSGADKGLTNIVFGVVHDEDGERYRAVVSRTRDILTCTQDIKDLYESIPFIIIELAMAEPPQRKH